LYLGRSDSVFPRLLNLVKFGLGGKQGDGQQYMAWVHEHDVARSTQWLLDHPELEGVFNCTAPESAEKNADMMQTIRKAYGDAFWIARTAMAAGGWRPGYRHRNGADIKKPLGKTANAYWIAGLRFSMKSGACGA
jgi:nucleoside-diphosphate-sugar epimerase